MIDRSKFLEPTPKFCLEFPDTKPEEVKDWYNADLIYIANLYEENHEDPEFKAFYEHHFKLYECGVTIDDVREKFEGYDIEMFNELIRELMTKAFEGVE